MDRFPTLSQRVQSSQAYLDRKGYGHLAVGVAAGLMLLVFCPISMITTAAPFWTYSVETNAWGQTSKASSSATLWSISSSVETDNGHTDQHMDMCGDEMLEFEECGKIYALRFFAVSAVLLSLASGLAFFATFSPLLKAATNLHRKLCIAGSCQSGIVFCWTFLSLCIAGSLDMSEQYGLDGAAFAFLFFQLLFVGVAFALSVCYLTKWSRTDAATEVVKVSPAEKMGASQPTSLVVSPTLLGGGADGNKDYDPEASTRANSGSKVLSATADEN